MPGVRLSLEDAMRNYNLLSQVERAFRSLKTVDLEVRPIRHHLESRVKTHIFLCMLAQYVVHRMIEAWRPVLFCDEDQTAKKTRDPVAPAQHSLEAMDKVLSKTLHDSSPVHSFQTLLKQLSTIVRNVCRPPGTSSDQYTFEVTSTSSAEQQRAYDLLEAISL